MRPVPQAAVDFVAAREGCKLESYQDQGSVWTIGWGHTGLAIHGGLRWTEEQAKAALTDDLTEAAARLEARIGRAIVNTLTENQYAALLSFVFNLGNGPDKPEWTIWKRLRAKQYDQVPVEMMRFVYCRKLKVQGLVNRRAAEVALWSTDEPGSVDADPPSGFTRFEATPPVTTQPVSLAKQPAVIAVGASLLLGLPSFLDQAIQFLTPLRPQYPAVAQLVDGLGHFSPVAAALAGFVLYLQHQQAKS